MENTLNIGKNIKEIRKRSNLSISETVNLLEIDEKLLIQIEEGLLSKLDSLLLEKISSLFCLSISEILNGIDENTAFVSFRSSDLEAKDIQGLVVVNRIVLNQKTMDRL